MNPAHLVGCCILDFHPTHGPSLLSAFNRTEILPKNILTAECPETRDSLNRLSTELVQWIIQAKGETASYFPFYGIPDGAHHYPTCLNHFIIRARLPSVGKLRLFGISCCLQQRDTFDSGSVRNSIVSSLVYLVLSLDAFRDYVFRESFRRESISFFEAVIGDNFEATAENIRSLTPFLLQDDHVKSLSRCTMPSRSCSFSPYYQFWQKWGERLLVLWKIFLTSSFNVIVYSQKTENLFLFFECFAYKMFPKLYLILDGESSSVPMSRYFQPYFPLNELDELCDGLRQGRISNFVIGTSNKMVTLDQDLLALSSSCNRIIINLDTYEIFSTCFDVVLTNADRNFMFHLSNLLEDKLKRQSDMSVIITSRLTGFLASQFYRSRLSATINRLTFAATGGTSVSRDDENINFDEIDNLIRNQLWSYWQSLGVTVKYYSEFQPQKFLGRRGFFGWLKASGFQVNDFCQYFQDYDSNWFRYFAHSLLYEELTAVIHERASQVVSFNISDIKLENQTNSDTPESGLPIESLLEIALESEINEEIQPSRSWQQGLPPFHPGRLKSFLTY